MAEKKWFPEVTTTKNTEKYKYVFGFYNHKEHGKCFRVSKYKDETHFVGHFVLVEKDWEVLDMMNEFMNEHGHEAIAETEQALSADKLRN